METKAAAPNGHPPEMEEDVPSDPLNDLKERLGPKFEEAQEQLEAVNQKAQSFIRKNPGTALFGAAALGFIIGRWASRK